MTVESSRAGSIVRIPNVVGESPVWDDAQARLLWLDQARGTIHEARSMHAARWRTTRQWELGRPLGALMLRSRGGFVLAAGIDLISCDESGGSIAVLLSLPVDPDLVRLNEAKCDARGRLWMTTLSTDFRTPRGSLYRVDANHVVTEVLSGVQVGNGFDWSPDGSRFYFADSMRGSVDQFDYDAERGTLANRRTFVAFEQCVPDGLTIDSEGGVWIAAAAAGEVRRYSPRGELLISIEVGTPGVTSCALGGVGLRDLFITSIGIRMPDVVLDLGIPAACLENDREESGDLFCAPWVAIPGRVARRFAG